VTGAPFVNPGVRDRAGPWSSPTAAARERWKGSKWVSGIEFMKVDEAGFWEELGYSMTANPFKEERYR
jgi:hypothetical protein